MQGEMQHWRKDSTWGSHEQRREHVDLLVDWLFWWVLSGSQAGRQQCVGCCSWERVLGGGPTDHAAGAPGCDDLMKKRVRVGGGGDGMGARAIAIEKREGRGAKRHRLTNQSTKQSSSNRREKN